MDSIDEKALIAAKDEKTLSQFIHDHSRFIIHCAYRTTHKFITQSEDEWSIALIAFTNAVKTYTPHKGAFLPYSELLIKRSLIDYYRSTRKYKPELSVSPDMFDSEPGEEEYDLSIKLEISEKISNVCENNLKYEIEAANLEFKKYGFSFYDLANCSPKSIKTKEACKQAVLYVLNNPILHNEIQQTKQLPIKLIQKNTNLPRKTLEHHRRYIIAAIVILSGEYPLLADYITFIRKEGV